jgi:4-hydroxy-3-polyprenylbenzoate decarboxylase
MGYTNLQDCILDLEHHGHLLRLRQEVSADLEVAAIQRKVFQAGGPAILFENIKNCRFAMLGNLFGTKQRLHFIFRDTLPYITKLFRLLSNDKAQLKDPFFWIRLPTTLWHLKAKKVNSGSIFDSQTTISQLPHLRSWPLDGGGYVTLPQVYSESLAHPGIKNSNLGMYRVQLNGNVYQQDREVGLHYQIHRGIGPHHAEALQQDQPLAVNVFIGGPPATTIAAIMPLPAGVSELFFANLLAGHRIPLSLSPNGLPVPAEADFCISGYVHPGHTLPEGPFGDHLGYYSLRHDFPVLTVDTVFHRHKPIWPFTTVGRPPQEDSVIGEFIHDLTSPLVPKIFPGIREIRAVDEAGVHPLLLAIGSERYVPFTPDRIPQEILTNALCLLGNTQTSLAKYVFIAAHEDNPYLTTHDIPTYFHHILERLDTQRDLHFVTQTTMDTLDYSGINLNQGSKVIIAAAGQPKRFLKSQLPSLTWPGGLLKPHVFHPGILIIQAPAYQAHTSEQEPFLRTICEKLSHGVEELSGFPLMVLVDDADFTAESWKNFLWVTFTRSDPAQDIFGLNAFIRNKHWGCDQTIIIDARRKPNHAPLLEVDPEIEKRIETLAARGGPLHGIIES